MPGIQSESGFNATTQRNGGVFKRVLGDFAPLRLCVKFYVTAAGRKFFLDDFPAAS
jgi:hypothetical protein